MANRLRGKSPRKDAGAYLMEQLRALIGTSGGVSLIRERPWASVTFTGTRHILAVHFEGENARDEAARFEKALPTYEFDLPRSFVADAIVVDTRHEDGSAQQIAVSKLQAELLTILDVL